MEDLWHAGAGKLDAKVQFATVDKRSSSACSNICWQPFVISCLEQDEIEEAKKYVLHVKIEDRFDLAMRCRPQSVL